MDNQNLAYEFINTFRNFKKVQMKNIMNSLDTNNTINEINILLVITESILKKESLNNNLKSIKNSDEKIHLNIIREKMHLAASTISPIITSLESKGYIEREIDEKDKRNTYIKLTDKGRLHTTNIHMNIVSNLKEYIKFMGDEDITKLIYLLNKTNNYMLNIGKDQL